MQSEGIEVVVPPLHSEVVTATIKASDLRGAQKELEDALRSSTRNTPRSPPGSPSRWPGASRTSSAHVRGAGEAAPAARPPRRQAGAAAGDPLPERPEGHVLEENDVAVLLRSDLRAHIDAARKALFHDLPYLP